jgi:hypothetical protein
MPVKADVVYEGLDKGCLLTPRTEAAKEWVEENLPHRTMRGEAVFIEADDEADAIIKSMEWTLLIYDHTVADMTVLEELEFYKALSPGKNFQMLAPSLNSLRTSGPAATSQEEQSSAPSPVAPGAAKAGPPSRKADPNPADDDARRVTPIVERGLDVPFLPARYCARPASMTATDLG